MTAALSHAIELHQQGQLDDAAAHYQAVLKDAPQNPDALALLGLVREAQGQFDTAIDLIQQAIRQDGGSGLFRLYLGNTLMSAGRVAEAAVALRHAVALQPDLAVAHYNLGNALRKLDDWAGAIDAYKQARQTQPRNAELCNNLALCYVHEKLYDDALREAKAAVNIAPDYGEGWLTLCNVAEQCKDYQLACSAGEHNVRLLPDNPRAWFGYGVALNRLDRHDEAIIAYERALTLKPDRGDIWDNLGQSYQSLNRLSEAEAIFRKAIEVDGQGIADDQLRTIDEASFGHRHWHLALVELLQGKYDLGFARYRSRFRGVGGLARPHYRQPLWRGENLGGKTLLVWDEQGLGDTLMLARYIPILRQQGARIIMSVHPALKPLFTQWDQVDQVVGDGDSVSGFDYHASFFDLPLWMGTKIDNIPARLPYLPLLEPDADTTLAGDGRRKIGVVWGGSPIHTNDSRRSIPLSLFRQIFSDTDSQFYSFNRDMKVGDAALLSALPIINLAPRLNNFTTSARLIRQMDLVITCDTATAHLAGALGIKTWVLLPFAPDWRWFTERNDSPWYPDVMRLFRQPDNGRWDDVIALVKQALGQFPAP